MQRHYSDHHTRESVCMHVYNLHFLQHFSTTVCLSTESVTPVYYVYTLHYIYIRLSRDTTLDKYPQENVLIQVCLTFTCEPTA